MLHISGQVGMSKDGKIADESYELRTRQFGSYIVGNRLGVSAQYLPDPFVGTYADFLEIMGYDSVKLRASLPKVQLAPAAAPVARPAVIAKPTAPIISKTPPPNNKPASATPTK